MHFKEIPLNKIRINDEEIMSIGTNSDWTITDVWFEQDIPVEDIDYIKIKIEKIKGE